MTRPAIVVMMKAPVPGRCKTRLLPALSVDQAAELYARFSRDVVASLKSVPAEVWIAYDPAPSFPTPEWAAPGARWFSQSDGEFGERLARAFETVFAAGAPSAAVIGTDAPSLSPRHVTAAFAALQACEAVLGPADDGGYYLVGLRRLRRELFQEIPWSTDRVLARTREILDAQRIPTVFLPGHYDVDSIEDLRRLASEPGLDAICPETAAWLKNWKEKSGG